MSPQNTLEAVINNITPEEVRLANQWFDNLGEKEQHNVVATIEKTQQMQSKVNDLHPDKPIGISLVVAGSSIISRDYEDVDLFMIPETYDNGKFMQGLLLMRGLTAELAKSNCLFRHNGDYKRGETLGNDPKEFGKPLTMHLMVDKFDFEFQRKEGDILYTPTLDSEHIIELNRRRGTNMRVLSRNYVFGRDYTNVQDSDLEVPPERLIDFYSKKVEQGVRAEIDRKFVAFKEFTENLRSTDKADLRNLCRRMVGVVEQLVYSTEAPQVQYLKCLINHAL